MKKTLSLLSTLALVAGLLVALVATPGGAVPVTVDLDCVAQAPIVGDQEADQSITVDVAAPASVVPNAVFPVVATVGSVTIPTDVSGFALNNARNIILKIPVPANATYQSASLSGGSNFGPGTPTIGQSGGVVTLSIPGPINAGQTFTPPAVTISLRATGALGTTVQPRIGGTSFSDTGFELTVNADAPVIGATDVPVKCFPKPPNPALSTTAIAADTTPPTATISVPADGGNYPLGAGVNASYSCADQQYQSGVASCVGTVPNGSAIDTSSLGVKSFTVTATDNASNSAPTTVTYTVIPPLGDTTPPTATISSPANGAVYRVGQAATASFSCGDSGGSGLASCVGSIPNGGALATSTAGAKTISVTATDGDGNPTTVVHAYRVITGATTTIGPSQIATIAASNSVNIDGSAVRFRIQAPTSNGNQLKVGDQLTIDWSIYKGSSGFPYNDNDGPDPINLVLPAPTNTTINGPVTTDQNGLNGETRGNAHSGSGSTGVKSVSPSANPSGASQIVVSWDSNSSPGFFDSGDGILMHVRFTATVTAPGTVQVQGFPGMTGTDCTLSCGDVTTDGVSAAQVGVSYVAVDGTPPTVNVASPAQGGLYTPGQVVPASFSCTDNVGTPTCVGDVANGAAVDTSTSGPKQFKVTSVDAAGNTAQKWITYNVVAPTATASSCSGTEKSTCAFTVSLSNPSAKTVTVSYATAAGTADESDYTPKSGVLTFTPGQTAKPVSVNLTDDALVEGPETFGLDVVSATNAYAGSDGTGTIVDGTVSYTIRFPAEDAALIDAAAEFFDLPAAELPKLGQQFLRFLTILELQGGGSINPFTENPPNEGPVVFTFSYTQAEDADIISAANLWNVTPEGLHWAGTKLIIFLYLIS